MRKLTSEEFKLKPDWATHYEHHFGILTPDAVTFYGGGKSVYCYMKGGAHQLSSQVEGVEIGYRARRITNL
jgi:hypothetical protein